MTIGPVSPWLVWGMLALAVTGAWAVLWQAGQGIRGLWQWWHYRGSDDDGVPHCERCGTWHRWLHDDALEELPPERSREELGFTGEQPAIVHLPPIGREPEPGGPPMWEYHSPRGERLVPWWEAEWRPAYQSLGLDYPSGMLARVREAGR